MKDMKRKDQKVKHRDKKKTGFEELSGKVAAYRSKCVALK